MPLENSQNHASSSKPGFFDVYESAAEQIPSGISDFLQNIKRNPEEFALNAATTVGESAIFAAALSSFIPAGHQDSLLARLLLFRF